MKRQRAEQPQEAPRSSSRSDSGSRSRSPSPPLHNQHGGSSSSRAPHGSDSAVSRLSPSTPSSLAAHTGQAGNKVSCLQCRSSKVKCLPAATAAASNQSLDGMPKCSRCLRLGTDCVYEKHKRGRKPEAIKYSRLESQIQGLLSELRSDKQQGSGLDPDMRDSHRDRLRGLTTDLLTQWSQVGGNTATDPAGTLQPILTPAAGRKSSAYAIRSPIAPALGGEDNLPDSGLPSLSNPLKLLVQASEDHGGEIDGREDEERGDEPERRNSIGRNQPGASQDTSRTHGSLAPRKHLHHRPSYQRQSAAPRGLYDADHDVGPHLDPISIGLLSLTQAQHLWSVFLIRLSHPLILLDPNLYVFDYVRPRSAMLLSVGVSLAARFVTPSPTMSTPDIAESIDHHVLTKIIPTILLDGKRSVHIIKAFALLAAYSGSWVPLGEDRSFSYVSWAWSMCVELDLNRRMVSLQADPNDEMLQRKLRERERTYLLCWTYSFSIALHTGRRCSLSIHDPMIAAAKEWHHSPYALPEDAGLVSNVQLRQLIARNLDYYTSHVAPLMPKTTDSAGRPSSPSESQPDPACRLLLDFHGRSITEDLDAWHATWVMPTSLGHRQHADRADQSTNSHSDSTHSSKPFRLRTTAFYHAYASLILHSLPLRHGSQSAADDQDVSLRRFTEQAQRAALSVMAFFLRLDLELITTAHNSIFLTAGFAAVYTLLRGSRSGRGEELPSQYSPAGEFETIEAMIEQVVDRMEEAGRVTEHRSSFASQQAEFLRRIVRLQSLKRKNRNAVVVSQVTTQQRDEGLSTFKQHDRPSANGNGYSSAANAYQSDPTVPSHIGKTSAMKVDSSMSRQTPSSHQSTSALSHHALPTSQHSGHYLNSSAIPMQPQTQTSQVDGSNSNDKNVFAASMAFDIDIGLGVGPGDRNGAIVPLNGNSGDFAPSDSASSWMMNVADIGPHGSAGVRVAGSPDALMDNLMMNNPIGLHLNSLLAPDPNWGPSDWSFFPTDVDTNRG